MNKDTIKYSLFVPDDWRDLPFDVNYIDVLDCWLPSPSDKEIMGEEEYNNIVSEYNLAYEDVLFSNTRVKHETCDCEYSCGHKKYPVEITFTDQPGKTIGLENEDENVYNFNNTLIIHHPNFSMYDFVRFCELADIQLQLK